MDAVDPRRVHAHHVLSHLVYKQHSTPKLEGLRSDFIPSTISSRCPAPAESADHDGHARLKSALHLSKRCKKYMNWIQSS